MKRASVGSIVVAGLLVLSVLAVVVPESRAPASPRREISESGGDAALWTVLLPSAENAEPDAGSIARRIVHMGPRAIGPVISVLLGRSAEPAVDYPVCPHAIEQRGEILTAALRAFPAAGVISALDESVSAHAGVDERLVVIRLYSEIATSKALERALAQAAELEPIQWQRTFVQVAIESSLARFVSRDPKLVRPLAGSIARADVPLAQILVRALAATRSPAAVPALLRTLGRDVDLDLSVMDALATLGERGAADLEETDFLPLRSRLSSRDARLRCGAASAVARLCDDGSAFALIGLLQSDDPGTVGAARSSLESISGRSFRADPDAWSNWLESETAWLDHELPRVVEAFASGDARLIGSSAPTLLEHPLFRQRIAQALHPLLSSSSPPVQQLVCRLLGSLRAACATPWLVELLDDDDDALRQAAWKSLVQLTGRDLPLDAQRWRAEL